MEATASRDGTMEDAAFTRRVVNPTEMFAFQLELQEKMKANQESFGSDIPASSVEEDVSNDIAYSPPVSPRTRQLQLKSALKSVSSYGNMERLGEDIPIVNTTKSWQALPKLSKATIERSQSSASFLALATLAEEPTEKKPSSLARVKSMGAIQTNSSTRKARSVGFGKIHVREHPMIVGDNPSCRSTLPVSLDWEYREYQPLCINAYEDNRGLRRSRTELQLSYRDKLEILKHVPATEIKAAQRSTRRVQQHRAITRRRAETRLKFDDLVESAGRKARRMLMGKSRSEGNLVACGV